MLHNRQGTFWREEGLFSLMMLESGIFLIILVRYYESAGIDAFYEREVTQRPEHEYPERRWKRWN